MKNKDTGFIGATIAGVALALVAGQLLWASWRTVLPNSVGGGFRGYASERLVIDPSAVNRMNLVEPTLPNLVKPHAVTATRDILAIDSIIDYAMFGHRPPAAPTPDEPLPPQVVASKPQVETYHVAMTYVSGEHRYAVIDSKLYRQNARLPGGEQLAEIAVGAVRLESPGGARWIKIEGPGTG